MARCISYQCTAVALETSDQAVLSQIVCVDQVPGQVYFGSNIIVRSGRREFPQKILSVAPGYPSHLEGWKNVV